MVEKARRKVINNGGRGERAEMAITKWQRRGDKGEGNSEEEKHDKDNCG